MKYNFWILMGLFIGIGFSHALKCEGTVHFQKPDSWPTVFMFTDVSFTNVTKSCKPNGWCEIPTGSIGMGFAESFALSKDNSLSLGTWVSKTQYNYDASYYPSRNEEFTCADFGTGKDLYITENPISPGRTFFSTEPPKAKYLYVMLPNDEKWLSSVPMLSLDGGLTGTPMKLDPKRCGLHYYVFFDTSPTNNVIIYRQDDPSLNEAIGLNGIWGEEGLNPIPLALYYTMHSSNTLYYITDNTIQAWNQSLQATEGWTDVNPNVSGLCSYSLSAVVYDTDASLHPAFSCFSIAGEGCQIGTQGISRIDAVAAVNACIGLTPGIVEPLLGPDNKPVLTKDIGTSCFHSAELFNQLFNETEGVNEMSCYNLPLQRENNGRWEFNSDYHMAEGLSVVGGFYPAEIKTDADVFSMSGNPSPAVPKARIKRDAEGPVFMCPPLRVIDSTEGLPYINLLCNGPAWTGGANCSGLFGDGDDWNSLLMTRFGTYRGWGWSCSDQAPNGWPHYVVGTETPVSTSNGEPRWQGVRNQHFCFESHAQFKYKPGLRFSIRGDDDIWVFVGGKLAVDLGGTHLAAPGYVNLDIITDKNGDSLVIGQDYPIDIFFCDRRTAMSNIHINTNIHMKQVSSEETSNTSYEYCLNKLREAEKVDSIPVNIYKKSSAVAKMHYLPSLSGPILEIRSDFAFKNTLKIFDVNGVEVFSKSVASGEQVSLKLLKKGVYFAVWRDEKLKLVIR